MLDEDEDIDIDLLKRLNKIPYKHWRLEQALMAQKFILRVGWKAQEHSESTALECGYWSIGYINPKTERVLFIDRALKMLLK